MMSCAGASQEIDETGMLSVFFNKEDVIYGE